MEPNAPPEEGLPERIAAADMEMLRQASEEHAEGQRIALRCEGALRFVHGLFVTRYALGPEDTFDEGGVIRRKPPESAPDPASNGVGKGLKDAIARMGARR